MKRIFKSKFQEIEFEPKKKIMLFRWKGGEESVNHKKFLKELETGINLLEEFLPYSLIIDTLKFSYLVTPEIQDKVSDFVIPKIDYVEIKRIAILLPDDEISRISIKQTVEEVSKNASKIDYNYFDNRKEALNWLEELEVDESYSQKQFKEILKILKES